MSIRSRLMLVFVLLTGIILLVFSFFVYYSTLSIRINSFYDRLEERIEISFRMIDAEISTDLDSINPSLRNTFWTILPEEEIIVYNENGGFYYINEFPFFDFNYSKFLTQIGDSGYLQSKEGNRQFVGASRVLQGKKYIVFVSASDKNGQRLIFNLKITLFVAYFASILFLILIGWYFSRESFKPIERIIETAEKISETDLDLRIPLPHNKNELAKLVITINESFDRFQKTIELHRNFVAHASHELRTPLTGLKGELELALLKIRTAEEYQEHIRAAHETSDYMNNLLNKLLLLAQTSSNTSHIKFNTLRSDEVVQDAIQRIQPFYPNRTMKFHFQSDHIDDSQLSFLGNEELIGIAVFNILDNALKYSSEKEVIVCIGVEENQNLNWIKITDYGIGIPPDDIAHIFEPFYRSKYSSNSAGGFGIGLALAKQIVELHFGKILVSSELSSGTSIKIILKSITKAAF